MKVLEYQHSSPYDGCFWRWEYIPFNDTEAFNISNRKWPYRESPQEIHENGMRLLGQNNDRWRSYDTFTVYDWDGSLHTHIPDSWYPVFASFAERMGIDFEWKCHECGGIQKDAPYEMAGYYGDGGIGINVDGWLCDLCAAMHEEEYA